MKPTCCAHHRALFPKVFVAAVVEIVNNTNDPVTVQVQVVVGSRPELIDEVISGVRLLLLPFATGACRPVEFPLWVCGQLLLICWRTGRVLLRLMMDSVVSVPGRHQFRFLPDTFVC
jgi:hypothetical protein